VAQLGFEPPGATLEKRRAMMRGLNGADVSCTQSGQKTETVQGWLTDLLNGT